MLVCVCHGIIIVACTEHPDGLYGRDSTMFRKGFLESTEIAEKEGVFQASESTVIKNLLNFKNISCEKLSDKSFVVKKVN